MKNTLKQSILFLVLTSLLFINGCGPKIVEHTITVTRVPERIEPPADPVYKKIPEGVHLGSKKSAMIIWKNFLEAERARKEAKAAYEAYDFQVNGLKEDNNDEN